MVTVNLYKNKSVSEIVEMPTEWGELSTQELQYIAEAIYQGKLSEPELFLEVLRLRTKNKKLIKFLDVEQAAISGLPLVRFIIEEIRLTKNPMPAIGNYHGPDDDFEDMTCGEFEASEICFFQLKELKEEKHLNELLAQLWRKKVNGKRIDLTDYDIKPHMAVFEKMNFKSKIIVFLWYIGCRENIAKLFPLIFNPPDGEESSTPPALAFTNCIHMGAGVKNGTRDNIRKMLMKEFLYDIHLQMADDLKQANQPQD